MIKSIDDILVDIRKEDFGIDYSSKGSLIDTIHNRYGIEIPKFNNTVDTKEPSENDEFDIDSYNWDGSKDHLLDLI